MNQTYERDSEHDLPVSVLTERQVEILKLLALGYSGKEIASKMHLALKSVESHKYRIMKTLGFRNAVRLCRYAIRNNLIEP